MFFGHNLVLVQMMHQSTKAKWESRSPAEEDMRIDRIEAKVRPLLVAAVWIVLVCLVLDCVGCSVPGIGDVPFHIVAESHVQALQDAGILSEFTKETGIQVVVGYEGPVDIRNEVSQLKKNQPVAVDAYWPGSSIWLSGSTTVEPQSVMKTFVVLAVDPKVAKSLGWDTTRGISAADVVAAMQSGKLKLAMTNATQSTPGASFFLAMFTALSGKPVITTDDLQDVNVTHQVKAIFRGIDRSAVDLGHLEQVFVGDKTSGARKTNAIVIYESLATQMDKALVSAGQEPMTVFYIQGATAIADFPIRYVDNGDPAKLDQYHKLVDFLKRADIQKRLQALGWRTCPIGMTCGQLDPTVFDPQWGIDTKTAFPEMIFPKPDVTAAALIWYQVECRKPSFTVYCLDYSGSMNSGTGHINMVDGMDMLLDQKKAAQHLLQAGPEDMVMVYGFSSDVQKIGTVYGNDPTKLKDLSKQIAEFSIDTSTAVFSCAETALTSISRSLGPAYNYSVILLTDGQSNKGPNSTDFLAFYKNGLYTVPVYAIAIGSADVAQLQAFTVTGGDVYDGNADMAGALRKASGNN